MISRNFSLNEDQREGIRLFILAGLMIINIYFSFLLIEIIWQQMVLMGIGVFLSLSLVLKPRDLNFIIFNGMCSHIFFYLMNFSFILEEVFILNVNGSIPVNIVAIFPVSLSLIFITGFLGYIIVLPIIYRREEYYRMQTLVIFSFLSAIYVPGYFL